jgi:FtsZ-interacting cell division protein ZipA
MMVVMVLLAVIVLLLVAIIAMLVTGWPGKQKEEMERLGNGLRREMAEQRSDSLQLMKVIRIEIEEAVRESVEREIAAVLSKGRSRKAARKRAQEADAGSALEAVAADEGAENSNYEKPLHAVQIPLFSEKHHPKATLPEPFPVSPDNAGEREPEAETIDMGYIDDIPDVE